MRYLLFIVSLITIGWTTWLSVPYFGYPLGGYSQADISNMYPNAITPAGFTFSIWSTIYLSWLALGLSILFKKTKITNKQSIWYSVAILLTGIWLIPWGYNMIGLSLIIMLILLGILKYVFHLTRNAPKTLRYSVDLTLGWINIATVANITIYLVSIGFTGGDISEIYWAIGILGVASILTAYYQCRYHTYIISLVFLWTLFGVWVAHNSFEQRGAVLVFGLVTIINMIISFYKKK
ncbi:tryptophan-rich sensory protein [Candidatus Gracilibacteria bacterium]|nr:tryptophan-rich sensory protein [Candidatus Gracilibacteria bacterium]